MKKTLIFGMIFLMVISMVAAQYPVFYQQPHTCAISTGHGLIQDLDCDKVPDYQDDYVGPSVGPDYQAQTKQQVYVAVPNVDSKTTKTSSSFKDTVVKIVEIQDVVSGGPGAVYPIKITNNARVDKRFILTVEGLKQANYRVDPSNTLIVKRESEATAYLYVMSDGEEGAQTFSLEISSGKEKHLTTLTANVIKLEEAKESKFGTTDWNKVGEIVGWILVVIVLIILAFLIVKDHREKEKEDDLYSYY